MGLRVGVAGAPEGRVGPLSPELRCFIRCVHSGLWTCGGCWDLVKRVPGSVVAEERGRGFRGCEGVLEA